MKLSHFGTDGIRGIIGTELDICYIKRIAKSIAHYLKTTKGDSTPIVLMGCDTRRSCDFISHLLAGYLSAYGIDVTMIGAVPTAAVSYLTTEDNFNLGIMVSASHNNYTYNGIKLFSNTGEKLDGESLIFIDKYIDTQTKSPESLTLEHARAATVGKITTSHSLISSWRRMLFRNFAQTFKRSAAKSTRIALDCANGSGAECAQEILQGLGFDLELFNAAPDGININHYCGATNPNWLSTRMKSDNSQCVACPRPCKDSQARAGYSVGFAFDGDADRLLVFDEKGNAINGDTLICLLAEHLSCTHVVTTILFNMGTEQYLVKKGISITRTPVGDRHISKQLAMQTSGRIGGEGSGHIIYPEIWKSGDGLITALLVLQIIHQTNRPLSELVSAIQVYPTTHRVVVANKIQKSKLLKSKDYKTLLSKAEHANPSSRIIVRPSGTENLIRITVESQNQVTSETLAEQLRNQITALL
jgi:phosphoglucosamine mutase